MTKNDVLNELARRQLIVVMGKGGVGKSVVAAVLGRALAARGRQTLALEVDPRENLHGLLGVPPSGGEIAAAGEGLWLQNLKPERVVDWVVERQVKIGVLARRVKRSPIYQRFVDGAPGVQELAVLGHALRLVRGEHPSAPAIDTVVLDAPATGHGVYLLTAPQLVTEAIGEGPLAELAGEVAELVEERGRMGLVVVALAEEMPVDESLELVAELEAKLGRRPELVVVNGLYPPLPDGADASDELTALWRDRRRVNELELRRLEGRFTGPLVTLPLLPADGGPALTAALLERLEAGLAAAEGAWT